MPSQKGRAMSKAYTGRIIAGHHVRVAKSHTGFAVWLDGLCIGVGTTYDEAAGQAVTALEAIAEALQGPPWVPTPRSKQKRTP